MQPGSAYLRTRLRGEPHERPEEPVGGVEVRSLRAYWRCSVEEAARRIGVSTTTWRRWERGYHLPNPANAEFIQILRVRYDLA